MKYLLLTIAVACQIAFVATAQNNKKSEKRNNFKIVSYNVENFFDNEDDPLTNDEEYLVGGMRGWNRSKYFKKQANISKVISSIGGWNPPPVVGLVEIESDKVLHDLTKFSPLKNLKYKYIHYESYDHRGIDAAMLYQPNKFRPFHSEPIHILFADTIYRTRDILYVAGEIFKSDTLHLFVCHFPSRWGGELESEAKRIGVAKILKHKVDSIVQRSENSKIVIMGDFNDNPSNHSVSVALGAKRVKKDEKIDNKSLYNLAYQFEDRGEGTHKFQAEWSVLDHFIVSGALINKNDSNALVTSSETDMHIYKPKYLIEKDERYLGIKPKRTYLGMKYLGGYADHFPITLDLWFKNIAKSN